MKTRALLLTLWAVSLPSFAALAADAPVTHRVLAADYSTHRLGVVDAKGNLEWEYPVGDIHDACVLPHDHLLIQTSWTHLVELDAQHKPVWEYNADKSNGNSGKRVEVHAFERFPDGSTLIAESGPGRLIEIDRDGKLLHELKLHLDKPDAHRDTRLARKLSTGNYLVCHEGDGTVREYKPDGKVVWEYNVEAHVYSAVRLPTGNTLIGSGDGSRVIEVNPAGKVVWMIGKHELPGIELAWVTMVHRLDNGNTAIVNCHAGPNNPQMIEVTPNKKVVWTFKDFKNFGNAMPVGVLLDAHTVGG